MLHRTQEERRKREVFFKCPCVPHLLIFLFKVEFEVRPVLILYFFQDERKRLKNAIIIQSFIRGYQDLKREVRPCSFQDLGIVKFE